MSGERLLRFLASKKTTIPIWSCNKSETLCSVTFMNGATQPSIFKPFISSFSTFSNARSALCASSSVSSSQLKNKSESTLESSNLTRSLCSNVSNTTPASASMSNPADTANNPQSKPDGISINVRHGLPHLTVALPSRNEKCVFVLRPITHTIGDLLDMLKTEDHGIDRAVIRNSDGIRMAATTSIQSLLQAKSFELVINESCYVVTPPSLDDSSSTIECVSTASSMSEDQIRKMGDIRLLVGQLYEALHVQEHQASQEQRLLRELEELKDDLAPLEEQRNILSAQAEKRTNHLTWLGLGAMSVQFGILARLTWWEYSWDIMEPVTYFVTYGTAITCYAYFVLTKQEYLYPDARDRQYLLSFHKKAKKHDWDVQKYNHLKEGIIKVENELKRLKDPLRLKLPIQKLEGAKEECSNVLANQVNMGNIKEMLKGKFGSSS